MTDNEPPLDFEQEVGISLGTLLDLYAYLQATQMTLSLLRIDRENLNLPEEAGQELLRTIDNAIEHGPSEPPSPPPK